MTAFLPSPHCSACCCQSWAKNVKNCENCENGAVARRCRHRHRLCKSLGHAVPQSTLPSPSLLHFCPLLHSISGPLFSWCKSQQTLKSTHSAGRAEVALHRSALHDAEHVGWTCWGRCCNCWGGSNGGALKRSLTHYETRRVRATCSGILNTLLIYHYCRGDTSIRVEWFMAFNILGLSLWNQ